MKRWSGQMIILALLTTTAAWLWVHWSQLAYYQLQLVAGLILILLVKNWLRPQHLGQIDLLIFTLIGLIIVFGTGGPQSPFFFLIYFLLFGYSFLLQPEAALAFGFILIIFLSPQISSWADLLETFSLLLVAPLALFFGQQYLKIMTDQKRIRLFQKQWLKDEKALESEEKAVLLWLSLNFRKTLAEIQEITAELLSQLDRLTPSQKTLLKKVRRKVKKLLKEGEKLEKRVDQISDD